MADDPAKDTNSQEDVPVLASWLHMMKAESSKDLDPDYKRKINKGKFIGK